MTRNKKCDKIKILLDQLDMSFTELAKLSGLTRNTIYNIRHNSDNVLLESIYKVSKILNVPIAYLIDRRRK